MIAAALTLLALAVVQPTPSPLPAPSPRPPTRLSPTFSLRVGAPLLASASVGLIRGPRREPTDGCPTAGGFLLQAEAGAGGARLDFGPAFTYCYTPFGSLAAGAVTASVLRTWGRPLLAKAGRTYAGGELSLGFADWGVGFGLLRRLDAGDDGRWLLTWSLGRGF